MKRHNFKGQGASHGNHKAHRVPGSIGACATPSRVFKGTRMAGRMGGQQVTALNLEVVAADPERELVLVKGAVPGARGRVVVLRDSVKTPSRPGDPDERTVPSSPRRGPRRKERPEPEARSVVRRDVEGTRAGHGRPRARRSSASSPTWRCCTRWSPPSWPRPGPAPSRPGPAPRCAAAGPSPTARRAPAGPARARPGRPSGSGGGVALGPKPRSYRQRTPKKMVRLALRSALSDRAGRRPGGPGRRLGLGPSPGPRTPWPPSRPWASSAGSWWCSAPTTWWPSAPSATCGDVQTIPAAELSAYDILRNDWVVFTDGPCRAARLP